MESATLWEGWSDLCVEFRLFAWMVIVEKAVADIRPYVVAGGGLVAVVILVAMSRLGWRRPSTPVWVEIIAEWTAHLMMFAKWGGTYVLHFVLVRALVQRRTRYAMTVLLVIVMRDLSPWLVMVVCPGNMPVELLAQHASPSRLLPTALDGSLGNVTRTEVVTVQESWLGLWMAGVVRRMAWKLFGQVGEGLGYLAAAVVMAMTAAAAVWRLVPGLGVWWLVGSEPMLREQ